MTDPADEPSQRWARVTVRYWAAARAAAGVESDALPVAGGRHAGRRAGRRARRCTPTGRGWPTCSGSARCWSATGPVGSRRPGRRTACGRATPWSCCRPSPAAERQRASTPCRGMTLAALGVVRAAGTEPRNVGARRSAGPRPTAFGAWRAARDGRFRGTRAPADQRGRRVRGRPPRPSSLLDGLGHDRWASAPRCCSSPPRSARRAARPAGSSATSPRLVPGVAPRRGRRRAAPRPGPPARASLRTPTTLVLDAHGRRSPAPAARRATDAGARGAGRASMRRDVHDVDACLA